MRRATISLLLVLMGLLVSLGTAVVPARPASAARLPRALAPHTLYDATWRQGLLGWRQDTSEWQVRSGRLTCACDLSEQTNQGIIVAPYSLGRRTRFAVEARIHVDAVTSGAAASMAIIARTSPQPDSARGVHAGSAFYETGSGPAWKAELWYGGNDGDPLAASPGALPAVTTLDQTTFNPDHLWHTYRLEIRERSYKLFIDGVPVLAASDAHFLSVADQRVGLAVDGLTVSISRFRILAL